MQETPQQSTQRLLGHIEGKDPLKVQRETPKKLAGLIRGLSRKQLTRKPAPGKWSISEILAHLADIEIVVAWRLRHILSNNGAPIQAYDQNVWAQNNQVQRDPCDIEGEIIASLPWGPTIKKTGQLQLCFYYEPTPEWELQNQTGRSLNLLADGKVYGSLEDQRSLLFTLIR